jgi:hypothetical protein
MEFEIWGLELGILKKESLVIGTKLYSHLNIKLYGSII